MSRLLETKKVFFASYYNFKERKVLLIPFSISCSKDDGYKVKVSLLGDYQGTIINARLTSDNIEQDDLVSLKDIILENTYNIASDSKTEPSEQYIFSYDEVLDLYFDNRTDLSCAYVEKFKLNYCHRALDENGYGYDLVREDKIQYLTKLYSDKLSSNYKKLIRTKMVADLLIEFKNIIEDYKSDTPAHRYSRNLRDERRDVTLGGMDKIVDKSDEYIIHEDEKYQMR